MMNSAQIVQDSISKYRHGVLVGNFVEDKFGKDLLAKGPVPDAQKLPTTKDHHDLQHSLYRWQQPYSSFAPNQSNFYQTARQVQPQHYVPPQKQTTYQIFHRQQVNRKVPAVQNNPRKQERLEKEGILYDKTRAALANKITLSSNNKNTNEVPDILTGATWGGVKRSEEGEDGSKSTLKIDPNVTTRSVNPFASYNIVQPELQKFQAEAFKKLVFPHESGEKHDILFGHGTTIHDFHKREHATTYDLSYNQQVKPQTQVSSFFTADERKTAKEFHRETFYEKNHQNNIPLFGDQKMLTDGKVERPYRPYTKTYDSNHMKHEYLRR